jgi:hypothetical protein
MQFTPRQLINKNTELDTSFQSDSTISTYVDNSGRITSRISENITISFGSKPATSISIPYSDVSNFDLETILFFENLGCSVLDGFNSEYQLVDSSAVSANTIQNPEIPQNPRNNTVLSTDKSFANDLDPFYEISSNRSDQSRLSEASSKTTKLASSVVQLQTDLIDIVITNGSGGSIPRQFKK